MMGRRGFARSILAFIFCWSVAACSYGFQGSRSPTLAKEGIHKIYVTPAGNKSLKPGVEHLIYNAMIQQIVTHRRVRLVQRPEDADAILNVTVEDASMGQSAQTTASNLNPVGVGSSTVVVATEYSANLSCSFSLKRVNLPNKKPEYMIWTGTIPRNKTFPANNQLDVLGNTASLINDSEFDRALGDLARDIASDAHESMLDMF